MGGILRSISQSRALNPLYAAVNKKNPKLAAAIDPFAASIKEKPYTPQLQPTPPPPETFDPEAVNARDRARRLARRAYGRGRTIVTGGQGAEVADLQGKKLLGS